MIRRNLINAIITYYGKRKKRAIDKLTRKQKLFVIEYIKDLNAIHAYMRAGYKVSERVAQANLSRMLSNAMVKKTVNELIDEALTDRKQLSFKVLKELEKLAFADIGDYLSYDKDGNIKINPSSEVDTKPLLNIIRTVKSFTTKNGDTNETKRVEFKLADKKGALDTLVKIVNLNNKEGIEITGDETIKLVVARGTEDWQ